MRHAVALFVAFHASSMVVLAIPRPPPAAVTGEPDPQVEDAMAFWRDALGPPFAAAEPTVRASLSAWTRGLGAVQGVFRPYAKLTGCFQGWTMFGSVPLDSERLEIQVRKGGAWTPLYVAGSTDATWRRSFFENERMRTWLHSTGAKGKRARFTQFADWVAGEVRAEDPEALAVRVQFVRVHIPPHAELASTGRLADGKAFRVETRSLK